MVREAWGDPAVYAAPSGDVWDVVLTDGRIFKGNTEAEALVTALEAASNRKVT